MDNRFVMTFARPEFVRAISLDHWRFAPRKRWAWLHRVAWWFLRKTGGVSNAMKETVEYKQIVIDRQRVSEQIMAAIDELHIAHIKPMRVYMGPDQFDEAMMEMRGGYTFDVRMGYNREIFGLPVTVIPWMRGVLIVPENR